LLARGPSRTGPARASSPSSRRDGATVRGHPPAASREARATDAPRSAATEKPLRVLLVDDDAALRMLYRFNLQASGVSVVEAEDGESALRLLADELPDVVLLDVMMPGLDGWAVAERLREDERTRSLPVIFITALAEEEARVRGLALGAAGYLVKPFNPATLAEQVEAILAGGTVDEESP
jgi:DNA-binding response OmpR family regulator